MNEKKIKLENPEIFINRVAEKNIFWIILIMCLEIYYLCIDLKIQEKQH